MFNDTLMIRPDPPLSFTLYFREGKDELTPESKQRLSDVLAEISRRSSNISEVTVVGHTDRVGSVEYNDRLSLQRSQKVTDDLVRIGIKMDIISVAGRGEREPLVPTEDEVAEPRNRRVEVSIR
jgi:outer membrane protein OmpA-like peptidoglycan-associated protein